MKKILTFAIALGLTLSVFFFVSETLLAFQWQERGITVKSQDTTAEGTRLFLEDPAFKSFIVIADPQLLTDPVKESILAVFREISETYNLSASNIEFKLKPASFQTTLVLAATSQVFGFIYHSLTPPVSVVRTSSAILNEFSAWKDFKIKTIQLKFETKRFQIVLAPETESPLVDIRVATARPRKMLISDLAVLFNAYNSWEQLALNELLLTIDNDSIQTRLTSRDGKKTINYTMMGSKPSVDEISKVSKFYDEVARWKHIDYKKMLLTSDGSKIKAVIVPALVSYNGASMLKNIPSGMQFRYDTDIQYDFRVASKDYFVRLKNRYSTEAKLLWQLHEAVKDPILYIQKYDPEFFYRQIEGIRNRQVEVHDELNSNLSKAYADLQERHEELKASYENLKKAHEAFIYGYITLENAGFMSTKPVDRSLISRIVEIKTENTDLTKAQVSEQLKKEKLNTPGKVIDLVFSLYFNEFK